MCSRSWLTQLLVRQQYQNLRAPKTNRLVEFVAVTGYYGQNAIWVLLHGVPECFREWWGRKRTYTGAEKL